MPEHKYTTNVKTCGMSDFEVDYYRYLRKNKLPAKYRIHKDLIGKIVRAYHTIVRDKILYDNMLFIMPVLRFRIRIVKHKNKMLNKNGDLIKKNLPIDWGATRKLWREKPELMKKGIPVYHLNEHTDGYIYKIIMKTSYKKTIKNHQYLMFKPSPTMKKMLVNILTDPYRKIDYYEK